ncbi:hypothetical protein psal_cds_1145 [Pandoravirus salinus]|uniref:Uncharacterized protein n=1 Tax=Pandoravirus salinus TaxID=1349410 RepID=S4VXK9_9VIRU|nr:hypothetical protein psal_cds_1145 [Pandoravirus salinus]AGO85404.1 hypothetical protein psal_cds_1145 [Pandoravirus salinus]
MECDGDDEQRAMQVEIADGDADSAEDDCAQEQLDRSDDGGEGGEDNQCDGDDRGADESDARGRLNVEAEVAALRALCHLAREGTPRPEQEAELARLKAGDVIGDVRLGDVDPAHGHYVDVRMIERYERMWSHLAASEACTAHMSTVASGWPPTLADVEQAYRDLDGAYRRRYRGGDHTGGEDPSQALIVYLVAEARAGYWSPGDILVDALVRTLERSASTMIASRHWPHCPDPFGGRSVPRHVHGSACVLSDEIDVDYFVLVARRSDTAEAVLVAVPEAGRAHAIAAASLLHGSPHDRAAASMPVDAAGTCRCVRPCASMLPAFLGAVATVLRKPASALHPEDGIGERDVAIADGARHVSFAVQAIPSLYDAPRGVIQALHEIDDGPYAWRQAEQLCGLWIEPGQLALALSLAAGARAATMVDPPASSLTDMAAAAYEGPLDAPGMCDEAKALVATRIWRRVCSTAADAMGRLPDGERLIDVALALGVAPTDAERAVPELLCGRLIEPAVRAMVRARGLGIVTDVQTMDAPDRRVLDVPAVQAMGVAARLAPDDDPTSNGVMVLADVIARQGGRVDVGRDLASSHHLAEALTRTLWPSASPDERAAWARLYAADPTSRPDPTDVALMEALALRMGIALGDHHRATAGALCGLLALAVHWPA